MQGLNELLMQSDIRNFSAEELYKKNRPPEELFVNIIPTLTLLQNIRDAIGRPIKINSAYRDASHNLAVGGKKDSLHLLFNAIDFKPFAYTEYELIRLVEDLEHNRFACLVTWREKLTTLTPNILGIGLYENFIHLDTRGLLGLKTPARWRG